MRSMSCSFFFFKRKTAYEMRISDWSSDVCSSDLMAAQPKGRLRVSMPSSLAQLFLPTVIRDFRAQHPDIECDFDLNMQHIDPISNPYDLVLRFGRQPDSSLVARQIVLMENRLFASPQYLSLHGVPRSPTDLGHHECRRQAMSDAFSN